MFLVFFRIHGHSMQPAINPGDLIIASRLPYLFSKPQKGDIVVIKNPVSNEHLVKRISKKTGDQVYLAGDNSVDSLDSRSFGWLPKESILAKVLFVHQVK